MSKLSRSSFLKTAGLATGAALVARRSRGGCRYRGRTGARRPAVRDAARADRRVRPRRAKGEVTIVSGLNETTFKDPALVKRMTKAVQHPAHKTTPARKSTKNSRGRDLDVVPSRSTRDQPGPGCRQHRRLRVPQPGQPEHRHDRRQLPPRPGAGGRPELLRVRRGRPLRDQHRQRRRRRGGHHLQLRVHDRQSRNPNTFLYNTGPIGSLDDPNWNRRQFYKVTRTDGRKDKVLGQQPAVPAVQHRPALDAELREPRERRRSRRCRRGEKVFAGQRNDPFYVDLGSTFDLGDAAAVPEPAPDPDGRVVERRHARHAERALDRDPGADLEADERRLGADQPAELEGRARHLRERAAAARCGSCTTTAATTSTNGPWIQVSRLGNPLFNEVIVPMSRKDEWNATDPDGRQGLPAVRRSIRSSRACCRSSTRACSRTSRR